jgi:hypothetical protein
VLIKDLAGVSHQIVGIVGFVSGSQASNHDVSKS